MIITLTDAWAEDEIERQLRALTPISCVDEAEANYKSQYAEPKNPIFDEVKICENDDCELPDTAEAFLSLITRTNETAEIELRECKHLLENDHELVGTQEDDTEEAVSEREEDIFLGGSDNLEDCFDSEPEGEDKGTDVRSNKVGGESWKSIFKNYHITLPKDLPIFQVLPKHSDVSNSIGPQSQQIDQVEEGARFKRLEEQQNLQEEEDPEERLKRREKERNERILKITEERDLLEQLQKREVKRIAEEVRKAEEVLKLELEDHTKRLIELEEVQARERERYQQDNKQREALEKKRREGAAVKIQSAFRGMHVRKQYGEELDRRISEKREELIREKILFYEEVIRKEKAAVEAELEKEREAEKERKLAEERAEEIRERRLAKEQELVVKQQREEAERREREVLMREEEARRSQDRGGQGQLHWLGNADKTVDQVSGVKDTEGSVDRSEIRDAGTPKFQKFTSGVTFNQNSGQPSASNGSKHETDNHNLNQTALLDNFKHKTAPTVDNANCNQQKQSLLGRIASKAKSVFRSNPTDASKLDETQKEPGMGSNLNIADGVHEKEQIPPSVYSNVPLSQSSSTRLQTHEDNKEEQEVGKVLDLLLQQTLEPHYTREKPMVAVPEAQEKVEEFLSVPKATSTPILEPIFPCPPVTAPTPSVAPSLCHGVTSPAAAISSHPSSPSPISSPPPTVPTGPTISTTFKHNPLTHSLETSLVPSPPSSRPSPSSRRPSSPLVAMSVDRARLAQETAKSEYRRRRKLRDDIELAREISDVERTPQVKPERPLSPPTEPERALSPQAKLPATPDPFPRVDMKDIIRGFEENYHSWRDLGLRWSGTPPPPPGSALSRFVSRNYPSLEPRVYQDAALVEAQHLVSISNPCCSGILLKNCSRVEVVVDATCERLREVALENCDQCDVNILNSGVVCLRHVHSQLNKIQKLPGELLSLDLDFNSISRITPLACSSLTYLTLSHNALVSARGLQHLPNLVLLDLSYNSLSTLPGIHKCGLLQHLDVSHNQLVKVPDLQNSPLLLSLNLSANGLTELDCLSMAWLPLLQKLYLVANGLSNVPSLGPICPLLHLLDISSNMLADTSDLLRCVAGCVRLEEIVCEGNEINKDTVSRFVQAANQRQVPSGKSVFSSLLEVQGKSRTDMDITHLPVASKVKILEQKKETAKRLRQQFDSGGPFELDNYLDDALAGRDGKSVTLAETGSERNTENLTSPTGVTEKDGSACQDVDTSSVSSDAKSQGTVIQKSAGFTMKSDCVTEQQHDPTKQHRDPTKPKCDPTKPECDPTKPKCDPTKGPYQEHERGSPVLKLQCLARGFRARLRFRNTCEQRRQEMYVEFERMNTAAVVIQKTWRGFSVRSALWNWLPWLHRRRELARHRDIAATKIQASYRGYSLRMRLNEALAQAVFDLSDCEDLDEVCSLNFNEDDLDQGWGLPPTPALTSNAPLPASRGGTPIVPPADCVSRETSLSSVYSQGPVPLLPLSKLRSRETSRANSLRSISEISVLSLPPSRRTTPTKRQKDMAAEWGVKNKETVAKLIQRSKKFGKHVSQKKKRDTIRDKILERARGTRVPVYESPPPNSSRSLASDTNSVEYQWDMAAMRQKTPKNDKVALHSRVYRNAKFNEPSGTLPPLGEKPPRPNFKSFR